MKTCYLALLIGAPTLAEPLFLDGAGVATDLHPEFLGGGLYPFAGLAAGDPIAFRFVFDSDATAVSNDGTTAVYEFAGAGSTMTLGASVVALDALTLAVSAGDGVGSLDFRVVNEAAGFSASVFFLGQGDFSLAPPTSLAGFDANGAFWANSDQNQVLLPILMGEITVAAITPAPGGMGLLGVGLLAAGRRARKR